MMRSLDPMFCVLVSAALVWLGLLWAGARLCLGRRRSFVQTTCAVLGVLAVFVPVDGMPLWNWVFTFCPNPSLPLLGLVAVKIGERLQGRVIFRPQEWRLGWLFGAAAGTVLYLHPLSGVSTDPYYWGWHHVGSVWALAGLALAAFACGNRAGLLFLAALVAFELRAMESPNGWDYVVDPVYWVISLGALAKRGLCAALAWRRRRGSRVPFPAVVAGSAVAE